MHTAGSINARCGSFSHLAQGNNYLRSQGRQTYLFDNGAFRLFNGVTPWSVLQSCAEYESYFERRLWCIDKRRANRDEVEINDALDHLFRAITISSSRDVTPVAVAQSGDGAPRSTKCMRSWLLMGFGITSIIHPTGRKGNIHGASGLCFGYVGGFQRGNDSIIKSWAGGGDRNPPISTICPRNWPISRNLPISYASMWNIRISLARRQLVAPWVMCVSPVCSSRFCFARRTNRESGNGNRAA